MASLTVYSKFPSIPDRESYRALIDQMHQDFSSYTKYHETLKEIGIVTIAWEARKQDLQDKKLTCASLTPIYQADLKRYAVFDDTRKKVNAIFKSFQAKKEICFPGGNCPEIDKDTLIQLKRLCVDLKPIQEEYDRILTSNLHDISEEFLKMKTAHDAMEKQLTKLKGLLETAGTICNPNRKGFQLLTTFFEEDLEKHRKETAQESKQEVS